MLEIHYVFKCWKGGNKCDHDFIESLLGASERLNPLQLPTSGDVLRAYSFLRKELKTSANEPTGVESQIVDEVLGI